jgi:hypothetical protein
MMMMMMMMRFSHQAPLILQTRLCRGGLKKLRPHGRGRATWPDGEEYKGQWWMGDPEGHGKMVFPTGESYTGDWSCGQRSGHGEWVSASGTLVYEGGFDGGRFHGFGRLTDAESGLAYEGGFEEGARHGTGRILDASTDEEVALYAVFDRDEPRGQRPPQRMVDSNVGMRRGGRDGRLYYYGEVGEGGEGADGLGAEVDEVQGKVVFSGQSFEGARHGLGMRLEIKEREYSGWFAFGEQVRRWPRSLAPSLARSLSHKPARSDTESHCSDACALPCFRAGMGWMCARMVTMLGCSMPGPGMATGSSRGGV